MPAVLHRRAARADGVTPDRILALGSEGIYLLSPPAQRADAIQERAEKLKAVSSLQLVRNVATGELAKIEGQRLLLVLSPDDPEEFPESVLYVATQEGLYVWDASGGTLRVLPLRAGLKFVVVDPALSPRVFAEGLGRAELRRLVPR